jgi:hypothetical protein
MTDQKGSNIETSQTESDDMNQNVDVNLLLAQMAKLQDQVFKAQEENKRLREDVERKAREGAAIAPFCKVSEKGAVSLYRINRQFPVTLYAEQWKKIFSDEVKSMVLKFIEDHHEEVRDRRPPKVGRPSQQDLDRRIQAGVPSPELSPPR